MEEYLSDSALNRAYQETGLSNEQIQAVEEALEACAHFYAILELKDIWRIVGSKLPVTRTEFEKLLSVFKQDPYMIFEILNEKEIYRDGKDVPLLVDNAYFYILDEDYKPKKGSAATIQDLFCWDYDRFDDLYSQRAGKPLTVPEDLLEYADPDYYTETKYTKALLKFLEKNLPKDIDPEDALIEAIRRIRETVNFSAKMTHFLWDLLPSENQTEENLEEYLNLYMTMQNHTPIPHNRGAAPDDLFRYSRPAFDQPASAGAPLSGNGFGMGRPEGLPDFSKIAELARMNPGSQPGFRNGAAGTLRNGKKIGPNDPCPCGSGKKYKKCCGSK